MLLILIIIFTLLDIDHLIADEFSAELAEGVAYLAGHDEESRPVLVMPLSFSKFIFKMHENE